MEKHAPHVVVIHGVGDPRPGETAANLAAGLGRYDHGRSGACITEVTWNTPRIHPLKRSRGGLALITSAGLTQRLGLRHLLTATSLHVPNTRAGRVGRSCLAAHRVSVTALAVFLAVSVPFLIGVSVLESVDLDIFYYKVTWSVIWKVYVALFGTALATGMMAARTLKLPAAVLGRTVLMTVLYPVGLVLSGTTTLPWFLLFLTTAFLGPLFLLAVVSYLVKGGAESGEFITTLIAIYLGALVVAAGLRAILGTPLKVYSDIVQYLSSSRFRAETHTTLKKVLEGIEPGRPVVIVGHSLGSMIAIDYATTARACDLRSVTAIITCGSPLSRFFCRFFADRYLPPSTIRTLIRRKRPHLLWLNMHQPFDYVGGRVFPGHSDLDHRLRFSRRLHTGYFGNESFLRRLSSVLSEAVTSRNPSAALEIGGELLPEHESVVRQSLLLSAWYWRPLLTLMMLGVLAAAQGVSQGVYDFQVNERAVVVAERFWVARFHHESVSSSVSGDREEYSYTLINPIGEEIGTIPTSCDYAGFLNVEYDAAVNVTIVVLTIPGTADTTLYLDELGPDPCDEYPDTVRGWILHFVKLAGLTMLLGVSMGWFSIGAICAVLGLFLGVYPWPGKSRL